MAIDQPWKAEEIHNKLQEILPEIIKIRQAIHAKPELRYEEYETANLILSCLQQWGYEVQTGIAGTGITALLDSGKPGKTVALRADMDALPIQEKTGLPYTSLNAGKMHACGHDGHVATLLAVAATLRHFRHQLNGKIKLIFQPAEEGGAGALAMVKAGVLKNPDVDAIFGYHNIGQPLGTIGVKSGCIFAGADFFSINIRGKAAHAATPEKSIDPIWVGSCIVQALQGIVSRNLSIHDSVVLSITEFHAGNAVNIIPEEARLTVSLRATSAAAREQALKQCQKISSGVAESLGAHAEMEFINQCPPTINTTKESQLVLETAQKLFGEAQVLSLTRPVMVTEDFSFFLEQIPGCFFLVGNGENSELHTPYYNFQDSIIPIAAQVLMHTAIDFLNQ